MSRIDVSKRTIGINFSHQGNAVVNIWAPLAKKAAVVLAEKGTAVALTKDDFGYWKTETSEIKPGDLYKIRLDEKNGLPDPSSLCQPDGVHESSQALDLTKFAWTDTDWKNIPLEEYIMYELHTGTFTSGGTFSAIAEKLDYLIDLGVNAIEIMPVAQFPGSRNWGYDGVFPYAVQNSYGGTEGLQHLVQTCHQKGLAVILDVVYNHLGPEGNYFGEFGPYFTDKYNTPWGNAINFDDAWSDGVRQYFIENALMWFRDFHIDALRLDAVHAIKDFSANHILREIKQHVNLLMAATGRKHYLIVELDLNDNRFINPLDEQGFGMDAQWIDEFHHALRVTTGQDTTGYYADFKGLLHLAKAYKDAYVYDGIYSPHRKKTFGTSAGSSPGKQFIVFSQNHDQIGNRMLGERTSTLVSFKMQKLLAGAVFASPYLPMLFMGEEYSEPHPFLYFVSHTDAELAEAVRKGRKAEFAAFHTEGEAPDPVAESTFNESKLQWELLEQEKHQAMFQFYKKLIALRKNEPALSHLIRSQISVDADEQAKTLFLHRWFEGEHVMCLMNFSKQQQQVNLPDYNHDWQKLLDSADPVWNGSLPAPTSIKGGDVATIQAESFVMHKCSN